MVIKYKIATSPFYEELKSNVDDYFSAKKISKYANAQMLIKSGLTLAAYLFSYIFLMLGTYSLPVFFLLEVVLGLGMAGIFLNIGHDASHNTFFRQKGLNRLLLNSLTLIGLNPYIFDLLHNRVHHAFTSIEGTGYDIPLEEYSILRLSRNQEVKPIHKYQVYYAPVIYCLIVLYYIFSLDFTVYARKKLGNNAGIKHPRFKLAELCLNKLLYLFFIIALPLIMIDLPAGTILLGILTAHVVASILFTLVGVLNHQIYESVFPEPNASGFIDKHKKEHELEVTIDFSPYNKVVNLFFGGFNTHVAHHLFPNICHIHYVEITRMIERLAIKHGLPYKRKSLYSSIVSHFRYLKMLSSDKIPA